jgi:hypothetical protein
VDYTERWFDVTDRKLAPIFEKTNSCFKEVEKKIEIS